MAEVRMLALVIDVDAVSEVVVDGVTLLTVADDKLELGEVADVELAVDVEVTLVEVEIVDFVVVEDVEVTIVEVVVTHPGFVKDMSFPVKSCHASFVVGGGILYDKLHPEANHFR